MPTTEESGYSPGAVLSKPPINDSPAKPLYDGGQQGDVWARVAAGKAMSADSSDLDLPSLHPLANQPG